MLFRDELKETMEALRLTQELENALKADGARGNSLSDMIKSYERYDSDDFDEAYEYRAYKRGLLHGRYNPLRWVAHERNQVMHQSGYLINNFTKFKYTLRDAIKYIKKGRKNSLTFESLLLSFFTLIPYFIPFGVVAYLFGGKLFMGDANPFLLIFGTIVAIALSLRFGELLAKLFELFYTIFDFIQKIATRHKLIFFALIFSYILWNKDLQMLSEIFNQLKDLL